jgi:hypothetical protein
VWDEQASCWASDAEVAETAFTAFGKSRHAVTGRLIVRRVRDKTTQDTLFPVWRHHACFTTSAALLAQAETTHRGHLIIEHINDYLKAGPLAHIPSGVFAANCVWLTCAALAFNLTRAAGALASPFHARAPRRHHPPHADHRPGPHRPPRPPADLAPAPQLALAHAWQQLPHHRPRPARGPLTSPPAQQGLTSNHSGQAASQQAAAPSRPAPPAKISNDSAGRNDQERAHRWIDEVY